MGNSVMGNTKEKPIYAFIDASNLFYGGEKSLGWKMDYQKLAVYLKNKYKAKELYYYGGIETYNYEYSILDNEPINLSKLLCHLEDKLREGNLKEFEMILLGKHIQKIKFYKKLDSFGYKLKLKPVKIYWNEDGSSTKKANCDVDMTFDLMKFLDRYGGVVVLSGDGDFAPVLCYLKRQEKSVTILARPERTAKEIKQLAGGNFRDFHYLKEALKYDGKLEDK